MLEKKLSDLAALYSVATSYRSIDGDEVEVSPETLRSVLSALHVDTSSEAAIHESLEAVDTRQWQSPLPPAIVIRDDTELTVPVRSQKDVPIEVSIEREDGTISALELAEDDVDQRTVDGTELVESRWTIPSGQQLGYHRLHVTSLESADDDRLQVYSAELIVTPARLTLPERAKGRHWGYLLQLYGLRSSKSWAIGDFADLAEFADLAARRQGASFVMVNAFNAGGLSDRDPSPFAASSRRYLDPLYIRVEDIHEVSYLPPAVRALIDWESDDQARHNVAGEVIDRDAVWEAKRSALEVVFSHPRSGARQAQFEDFRSRGGTALESFAFWCAAAEQLGPRSSEWPGYVRGKNANYQDRESLRRFKQRAASRMEFFVWLQWIAEQQLLAASDAARAAGLSIGIVRELSFGDDPEGAEAWTNPNLLARKIHVGSPPTQQAPRGEDSAQSPLHPDALRALAYEPFRAVVRAALRGAQGLSLAQIDSVFRQWWIPAGNDPADGTYVDADAEAVLGIIALEAHRADAVVFTRNEAGLSDEQRGLLRDRGFIGSTILWDESESGLPVVGDWPEATLALVGDPDSTPTSGFLAGEHLELREQLGLLTSSLEEERAIDERVRRKVIERLIAMGLLSKDASEREILQALYAYLTRTQAQFVGVPVADAVGGRRPNYQPASADAYPSWKLPLVDGGVAPVLVDNFFDTVRVITLARLLSEVSS
ncbi:4-alpha-glucanotransferase [Saxibacter everestensis]|uniref:4-alpha-glucanotransferase n=1 Tax=Saxibacter everestensis TaxID=2909229 RepID=A0ABY8QNB0_9MICO|nr:4-alpha-glucanotransferase [Brevibacteriaceae bacterium ZFBP1038]